MSAMAAWPRTGAVEAKERMHRGRPKEGKEIFPEDNKGRARERLDEQLRKNFLNWTYADVGELECFGGRRMKPPKATVLVLAV